MGWTSGSASDCAALTLLPLRVDSAARSKSRSAEACFALGGRVSTSSDLAAGVEEGFTAAASAA